MGTHLKASRVSNLFIKGVGVALGFRWGSAMPPPTAATASGSNSGNNPHAPA